MGPSYLGEAFTIGYDLPNLTAYAETCAAIGLVFFSQRMSLLEQNSVGELPARRPLP
ncbi:MAG: beta-L-arabinofuranosidase domain-containing protein [Oscillospiraceae bacterium]